MVPLGAEATEHALDWLEPSALTSRLVLRHALLERRPGLWGDDKRRPSSIVWLRDGEGQREAFAAGDPEPALGWLSEQSGTIALLATESWETDLLDTIQDVERATIITRRYCPRDLGPDQLPKALNRPGPAIATRPLGPNDATTFNTLAPSWALRNWGGFHSLMTRGACFCALAGHALAAMAWVVASDERHDALGVYTIPRFRELGLGRAATSALIRHVVLERKRQPLWTSAPSNTASLALASSLGLKTSATETLLRWSNPAGKR